MNIYPNECYLMEGEIFSHDLFNNLKQELKVLERIPFRNDVYHREYININQFSRNGIRYYPVKYSNGKLIQWEMLQNSLIDNPTILKAIEVALQRFGVERRLDGEERFAANILSYSFREPGEIPSGPWHNDYACDWTMITMLSNPEEWEGGRLNFIAKQNPGRWLRTYNGDHLIQKTAYVKNRAIMFQNDFEESLYSSKGNYHSFEEMKVTKPVDRILLTLFQFDKNLKDLDRDVLGENVY